MTEVPAPAEAREKMKRPETPPSSSLQVLFAKGMLDEPTPGQQIDGNIPTEVSRTTFNAFRNQSMAQRKKDEEAFAQKVTVENPKASLTPEQAREIQMAAWAKGAMVGIGKSMEQAELNNISKSEVGRILHDKLHLDFALAQDGRPHPDAIKQFYEANTTPGEPGQEGSFYKEFCTPDMQEKLARALTVEQMMLLKPLLANWMVGNGGEGSEVAFAALVALRHTMDAMEQAKTDTATQEILKSSMNSLAMPDEEKPLLRYVREGRDMKDEKHAAPSPEEAEQDHSQAQTEQTDATEPAATMQSASEDTEPHDGEKRDTEKSPILNVGISEDIGGRHTLEDRQVIQENLGGKEGRNFYAVYDGHGGKEVADRAAVILHQNLINQLDNQHLSPLDALKAAYKATDELMQAEKQQSGATAVTVLTEGNRLYVANLGDARAIIVHDYQQAERLSHDQKVSDPAEQADIKTRNGRLYIDPRGEEAPRLVGIPDKQGHVATLAVPAALGDFNFPGLRRDPVVKEIAIKSSDKWLILACDGIWDTLRDQNIPYLIGNETDPQKVSDLILREAAKLGSTDNLSVIAVPLEGTLAGTSQAETQDPLAQEMEAIMQKLRIPGIRRLGKEIILTNEDLQQMQTFAQTTQEMLMKNAALQELLRMIKEYAAKDTGFSIAVVFAGTGIVADSNVSRPTVVSGSQNTPMRIKVPPYLYNYYIATNETSTILSTLQEYRDSLGKGGTGKLGANLAKNIEKVLSGYRQLTAIQTPT